MNGLLGTTASVQRSARSGAARRRQPSGRRRGAMLVLIALMLAGFIVTLAFSVDLAQTHLTRTELQTSTDAAAKAAAGALSDSLDIELAIARGQAIAEQNRVHGQPLRLNSDDFQLGHSVVDESGAFQFTPGGTPTNSVRVRGGRPSNSPSGVMPLLFGNFFGHQVLEPPVTATATYIERELVLVIDRSASMQGDAWSDLKFAINTFVETLKKTPSHEHVGLASYSRDATQDVPLTQSLSQITTALPTLNLHGTPNISAGMEAGEAILAQGRSSRFVQRTMIVVTGAKHYAIREPSDVAAPIAERGVKIHTITFGRDANRPPMQKVASIGGGNHFHSASRRELEDVFRELALTQSTMMTE